MNGSIYEAIVIGAGHAGLSASYFLRHLGLEHIVFERGRIGETWRSQRWDSFRMVTRNNMNVLPGSTSKLKGPEQFGTGIEFANSLRDYVNTFELPVSENSEVVSIDKVSGAPNFNVKVLHDNEIVRSYDCWQIIIASGMMNKKLVPPCSAQIAHEIKQLHAGEYTNASLLPEGSVLVVGSGQSGCQIAEDLIAAGRKVFLSTSIGPRVPRSYRGKDIMEWLMLCKSMEVRKNEIVETAPWMLREPVVSTQLNAEDDLSIQMLANQGAVIMGRLLKSSDTTLFFDKNAADAIRVGNEYAVTVKRMIDDYIESNQLQIPEEDEAANMSYVADVSTSQTLAWKEQNIRSIIWATGFTGSLDYVKLPLFNGDGSVIEQQGVTPVDGLYIIGLPWQRARKSNYIFGVKDDAGFVTSTIYSALR